MVTRILSIAQYEFLMPAGVCLLISNNQEHFIDLFSWVSVLTIWIILCKGNIPTSQGRVDGTDFNIVVSTIRTTKQPNSVTVTQSAPSSATYIAPYHLLQTSFSGASVVDLQILKRLS